MALDHSPANHDIRPIIPRVLASAINRYDSVSVLLFNSSGGNSGLNGQDVFSFGFFGVLEQLEL